MIGLVGSVWNNVCVGASTNQWISVVDVGTGKWIRDGGMVDRVHVVW